MSTHTRLPFWSDTFDGDLFKLVPQAEDILSPIAHVKCWIHGGETLGRLNHPCVWNTFAGLTAYVTLREGCDPRPAGYITRDPLVECTIEELIRDVFVHCCVLRVDGQEFVTFAQNQGAYLDLLFAARGVDGYPAKRAELVEKANGRLQRIVTLLTLLVVRELGPDVLHPPGSVPPEPS